MLVLAGCSSLEPYSAARASKPADEFLRVADQWVHVERMGTGPAVLLIHGFGGSTYSWREVQAGLADSFELVAVDLNGFGYTERPRSAEAYSPAGQAALLLGVLDQLGVAECDVMGHSYGAGLALQLAHDNPERIRRVVLVDGVPLTEYRGPSWLRICVPLASRYLEWFLLNEANIRDALEDAVYDPSVVTDEMVTAYLRPLRIEGLDRTLRGFIAAVEMPAPALELSDVSQPVLVIWGAHDEVFPLPTGASLAAELPDALMVILNGSAHLPAEEEPAAFVRAVRAFLQ